MSQHPTAQEKRVAGQLCERVDWECPELGAHSSFPRYPGDDPHQTALALIQWMRARDTPHLGYSRNFARLLRERASPGWKTEAARRWEDALTWDIFMPHHSNPFAHLGPEVVLVAATPDLCARTAQRVLECEQDWSQGYWGSTFAICQILQMLWPLEECEDASLLPVFGWLLTKSEQEWKEASAWDESTLGISGHNWWAHTLLGFWMMGAFFPELKGMARFAALADDYLEREIATLFEEDGWSKEGAPGYHQFAFLKLAHFAALSDLYGAVLSETSHARLRVIADAPWKLVLPDGDFPLFGDSARGGAYRGFSHQGKPDTHSCQIIARFAALFSLPEAKFVAAALGPQPSTLFRDCLPLHGKNLMPAWKRLSSVMPACDTALPRSGLYVMRQNWTPQADCLALVAGSVGSRVTSHKHADLLSFELYSRGRRLLVDNGYGPTLPERTDLNPRMWRVSSAAHNTTTVDGEDHVPIVAEFLFGGTASVVVDDWRSDTNYCYFSGVHEGYLRLPSPVSAVRRKLFYLRGRHWVLLDRFTSSTEAEHAYRLHFQVNAPGRLDEKSGRFFTQGEGGNLLIVPVPGADGTATLHPHPYPMPNYENPQQLCYTQRVVGHCLFTTLLIPFEGDCPPAVEVSLAEIECDNRILSPWEGTGLRYSIDGESHFYFDQHMQWNLPWKCGAFSGQGRLFHSEVLT